jgi:hypothetical protein
MSPAAAVAMAAEVTVAGLSRISRDPAHVISAEELEPPGVVISHPAEPRFPVCVHAAA